MFIVDDLINNVFGMAQEERNANLQREFAQQGLGWKIEDAERHGVHPLAALGASGAQASPVYAAREMGQDISRAASAMTSPQERELVDLQIERARIENGILMSQLRQTDQKPPGVPDPYLSGAPSSMSSSDHIRGWIRDKALERTKSDAQNPNVTVGVTPEGQWSRTANGLSLAASPEYKQLVEDSPDELRGWLRREYQQVAGSTRPPDAMVRELLKAYPGATGIQYNFLTAEWVPYFPPKMGSKQDPYGIDAYKQKYGK